METLLKHSNITKSVHWKKKKKRLQPKVIIYKVKHESPTRHPHILYTSTIHRCTTKLCQHFTIVATEVQPFTMATVLGVNLIFFHSEVACPYFTVATEHKHLIMATQLFNHHLPGQESMYILNQSSKAYLSGYTNNVCNASVK